MAKKPPSDKLDTQSDCGRKLINYSWPCKNPDCPGHEQGGDKGE
jgi:hypothetical protein